MISLRSVIVCKLWTISMHFQINKPSLNIEIVRSILGMIIVFYDIAA